MWLQLGAWIWGEVVAGVRLAFALVLAACIVGYVAVSSHAGHFLKSDEVGAMVATLGEKIAHALPEEDR